MGTWTNVKGMAVIKYVPKEYCADMISNIRAMSIPEKYFGIEFIATTGYSGVADKHNVVINVLGDLEGFTQTRELSEWLKSILDNLLIESYIVEISCPYFECREEDRYILIK